ncbi:concanavalin A-like lectin/glucanase domain-containing protein [Bombardia bombarda]|uniref:Concanavalin A-like lectin/glucanase domain-containing protein n=1 Tax=Bombardia bombarda TaxID=252184 RepID=A0AA40BYP2_9PEZI|nr:concanavalin A-like lectin/glucanase domain-containing protein [Bombardia bombarda]
MVYRQTPARLLAVALVSSTAMMAQAASQYTLVDNFNASNFFNEFTFFSEADPTSGYVVYLDAATANQRSLAGYSEGGIFLGVDYENVTDISVAGRASIRVESKKMYNRGLFVADIAHMPAGVTDDDSCGLWPAYWTKGPKWLDDGEIDIIEGINNMSENAVTLHTQAPCVLDNTGAVDTTFVKRPDCSGGVGCLAQSKSDNNYGARFNAAGGGIYVHEWTDDAITAWFFSHSQPIPDSLSGSPNSSSSTLTLDTTNFGTPLAKFSSSQDCSMKGKFNNHNIVFNTDFCGGWAGVDWHLYPPCLQRAKTCEEWVANNPSYFETAYWLINSVKVYQPVDAPAAKREDKHTLHFTA